MKKLLLILMLVLLLPIIYAVPTATIVVPGDEVKFGEIGHSIELNFTINADVNETCWYQYNNTNTTIDCASINESAPFAINNVRVANANFNGYKITPKRDVVLRYITKSPSDLAIKAHILDSSKVVIVNGTFANHKAPFNYKLLSGVDYYLVTSGAGASVVHYSNTGIIGYPQQTRWITFTGGLSSGSDEPTEGWSITALEFGNITKTSFNITSQQNLTFYSNDTSGTMSSKFISWNYTLLVVNQTFNAEVTEGEVVKFKSSIILNNTCTISSADLVYNNTVSSGTIASKPNNLYDLSRILNIPLVDAEVNNSFYWNITYSNCGTQQSLQNNQSVLNIGIDDCSAFSILILNYTMRDEVTQSMINETNFNTSVEVQVRLFSVGGATALINFSQNYTKDVNPQVCLESDIGNTTYEMYVQTRYDADDYSAEFHNIQNLTFTNTTAVQDVALFDLKSADATKFLITFKDNNFLGVEDALIDIQRKYIAEGLFKSVEIPLTDADGQATAQFDLDGAIYTIVVSKFGEILATFDEVAVVCQDAIIGDCRINLNSFTSDVETEVWENLGGLGYTFTFNRDTRVISVIFSTTDGSTAIVLLNTTKYDRFGNQTVCTDTITSSSGTLTCSIPDSFGNVTVVSELLKNGEIITTKIFTIFPDADAFFGGDVDILLLILIITIPLMLVTSTIGFIFGIIISFIMAILLMIYSSSNLIGVTSIITWLAISGGIIIYKISRRTN